MKVERRRGVFGVLLLPPGKRMWALAALLQAGAFLPAARLPAAWTSARGTTSRPTGRAAVRQCAADTAPVQLWHVQLFNDDFNMREHVSRTLMMVADLSAEEANRVMQATNWNGAAVVGTWEREVAGASRVEVGFGPLFGPSDIRGCFGAWGEGGRSITGRRSEAELHESGG